MIEVFYCTMPQDAMREAIALPCWMRWNQICQPGTLAKVEPPPGMSGMEFQGWRRQYAEDRAIEPFYIVADDDCMPLGNRFLERCEELMERYPEYAVLGATEACLPYGLDEVSETTTAGGINVIRRGILTVPPFDGQIYDGSRQGQQVREKGYKVGRMRDVRRNHYGEGMSTVWPDGYASSKTQVAYLDGAGVLV